MDTQTQQTDPFIERLNARRLPEGSRDLVWTAVTSSNIKAVGYDDAAEKLYIEFVSGGVYRYRRALPIDEATLEYPGFPKPVYYALLAARSAGKFFLAEIKGKYEFEKVTLEDSKLEPVIFTNGGKLADLMPTEEKQ
jgi:hypothetical protein